MKKIVSINLIVLLLFTICYDLKSQKADLAKDYYRHNLIEKSKELFIEISNSDDAADQDKTEALYWLGQISFDESNYSIAFKDWEKLIETYPESTQAIEIKSRMEELKDIIEKVSLSNITSVVARSFIKNGDFWSEAENKYTIDNSWLPNVELAIEWYDRVIQEFPNSTAAEIAFKKKLFTLLGWKERGQYGSSYGVKNNLKTYMPKVLNTFAEFKEAFPESSSLQGFRYLIAQAYWNNKKWNETREWLQKIIDSSGEKETFYTQAAKARLKKVEY